MDSLAPEEIAAQFAAKYYADFQADRKNFVEYFYSSRLGETPLTDAQREHSTLTFESNTLQGVQAIGQKWTEDFLKTAKHQVTTTNAQRAPGGFVIVLVTGLIQLTESDAPMNFTQSFLISIDEKGVFCNNDLFKLVYG
ncbi:hypothetical protein GQX73_g1808 [Xylaria multiplex]|uniref:NTF2-related export protein n=1 Tax=Xylaria multiplex TaxID=323545 RepID=A0A7C8IVY2_9PEZI|nr:hypothetical protein GQX73_g1808 [Xylaria multiplex]